MTNTSKVLVVKGIEGLGVRLWTLANAVEICVRSGRGIIVDWNDSVYGDKTFDPFYDFFELAGIPSGFHRGQLTDADQDDIYHPLWRGKLARQVHSFYKHGGDYQAYRAEEQLRKRLGYVSSIDGLLYRPENTVVIVRCHTRKSEFISRILPNLETEDYCRKIKRDLIGNGEYVALNVRYTDKTMPLEVLDAYFEMAFRILNRPKMSHFPVFLATDSIIARERAGAVFGDRLVYIDRWLDLNNKTNHQNKSCPDRLDRYRKTLAEMWMMGQAEGLIHFDGYTLNGRGSSKSCFATSALNIGMATAEDWMISRKGLK